VAAEGGPRTAALDGLLARLRAVPGVTRAGLATQVPLAGGGVGSDVARLDEDVARVSGRQIRVRFVSPGYVAAVGGRQLEGREFTDADARAGRPVAIVNEALARRLGFAASPVGDGLRFAVPVFDVRGPATPWTIVGLVADSRDGGPRQAAVPEVYLPLAQAPDDVFEWIGGQVLVALGTEAPAASVAPELRHAVAASLGGATLHDVRTLDERFRAAVARDRLLTALLVALGTAGTALSAAGVAGVIAFLMGRRRREIALRLALGASPRDIVRGVVGEGARLGAAGVAIGLAASTATAGALRALLFGVSPYDPLTIAAVAPALLGLTALATWWPARRAAAVDPAAVLRED
jgi:hypothetical protein